VKSEKKIELLAPARDKKCAKAAIDYGADAIYIGANCFGARKNAPNSLEDIQEVVEYAHKFNVKVYVTINTILTDEEILQAKALIKKLSEIGVDAIIVQDMGLLEGNGKREKGKETCHFHASTQCDNRTPEKVKFLEDVGFSRVILARELSIEQIKEIKQQTNVELETFIHGALCVSYSGQCYLSHLIGGRSSNRGECAQPCRKKYSLVSEDGDFIAKDKHLLNLKDFNASKHIKALAEAGVTSFKIEGRLKDENYVKNVVGYYRKLIDELGFKKTSSGQVLLDFEPNLEKSFNRGFTDYFLRERAEAGALEDSSAQRRLLRESKRLEKNECYSFDSPKSKGEYIGKVSKVGENYFEITGKSLRNPASTDIHAQDGLCFYIDGELSGCLVNKVDEVEAFRSGTFDKVQKIFPYKIEGIKVGTEIYRNLDVEFEKKLKNSKTFRKIGVNIEFDLGKAKVVDEDGNWVEVEYTFEELAQNEEKMIENISIQLKKSGESDFWVNNVEILTEKIPFLPVSKLNELRRDLLEKLSKERVKREKGKEDKKTCHCEEGVNVLTSTKECSCHCEECSDAAIQEGGFGLLQPKLRNDEILDYRANVLNKYAKEFYEKHGCKVAELALESVPVASAKKSGRVAMTTKHCLKHAFNLCKSPKKLFLIDEKNKRYELKFDCDNCEMEIIF